MYPLATVFPPLQRLGHLPLSRDQLMLLMVAINQVFLGIDTYLAHNINGTIRPNEWIPIIFGLLAGGLLLLCGLIALKWRTMASVIATLTLLASIVVGLLGSYFHLEYGLLPSAPVGERITIHLLVFAPPILGPMVFAIVGVLGISAAWLEEPANSGTLILSRNWRIKLPYSKTQAYFYIVGMALLATLVSSTLDHARLNFGNPWLWVPIAVGVFGTAVTVTLGFIDKPTYGDFITYTGAMALLIIVGLVGAILHIESELVQGSLIVKERLLRGPPALGPLLFCNVGILGFLVLLDPVEMRSR